MLDRNFYSELDAFYRARDIAGAETFLREQLDKAWEDEYNHADRATILNELMGHYRSSEQFDLCDEAMKMLLRELRALGLTDGQEYATFLLNIANACRAMGRLDEAERAFIKVRDIYSRTVDFDDYRVASLDNNLGLTYRAMGEVDKARRFLTEALQIAERLPGAYEAVAATCSNLANLSSETGRPDEAASFARRAIDAYEKGDACGSSGYAAALAAAARIEFDAGRFSEAAGLYESAAGVLRSLYGDTPTVAKLEANRAEAAARSGN